MGGCWPRMLPWHLPGSGEGALPRGCELWNRPKCSELLLTLPALGWGCREGMAWGGGGGGPPRTHQISQLGILRLVTRSIAQPSPWQAEVGATSTWMSPGSLEMAPIAAHSSPSLWRPRNRKPGSAHILQGRVQRMGPFLWALSPL